MNQSLHQNKVFNGFTLKMIAIVTMLVDHVGAVLYPNVLMYRYIGRIAFPIFVFLLIEGFFHTRDVRKYALRLFLFVLISEIPFDLAFEGMLFDWQHQNVFFTLFLGLLMMIAMKKVSHRMDLQFVIMIGFGILAYVLHTDYNAYGIMLIFVFYQFRNRRGFRFIGFAAIFAFMYLQLRGYYIYQLVCYEVFTLLPIIPITLYNGERGFACMQNAYSNKAKGGVASLLKYGFYVFYPVHLLIIHIIDIH